MSYARFRSGCTQVASLRGIIANTLGVSRATLYRALSADDQR
jgi:DNA-binding phage protein